MIIILTVLAVARVTRLITTDTLFEGWRNTVVTALMKDGSVGLVRAKLAYLIVCDWCASVYVGAAGAGAYAVWGETMPFMVICLALSASCVTGILATVTNGGD